jgi:hypothetical protein
VGSDGFMASIERTAYPRFKRNLRQRDLSSTWAHNTPKRSSAWLRWRSLNCVNMVAAEALRSPPIGWSFDAALPATLHQSHARSIRSND